MNDYKLLRTFLLAAEKRTFAQVARELDMTPAAVTRAIAALEEDLGVQLFVRTTRQVSLTTDGAIFADQIGWLVARSRSRREFGSSALSFFHIQSSARLPHQNTPKSRTTEVHG